MRIDLAATTRCGGDLEASNEPEEKEVQQAAGQRDAGTAAITEAVGEEWGVGPLEPALGLEYVCVVGPEGWIWKVGLWLVFSFSQRV